MIGQSNPETVSKLMEPVRRLLLSDKNALDTITKWFERVKTDWTPLIHELGFLPGSDLEKSAWLMLMGFVTQDSRHIIRVTFWNRRWVQKRCQAARDYGIWRKNGMLKADWLTHSDDQQLANTSFMLDVMLINGDMERSRDGRYRLSPQGLAWANRLPAPVEKLPQPTRKELARYSDDDNPYGH